MPDHVYRIIEVAGSSEQSLEDAIRNAVSRASRTLRQVGWFEVLQTTVMSRTAKIAHFQVVLKVGFTLKRRIGRLIRGAGGRAAAKPLRSGFEAAPAR